MVARTTPESNPVASPIAATIGKEALLSSVSKASFPIVAAIGGMAIPALIYVAFNTENLWDLVFQWQLILLLL